MNLLELIKWNRQNIWYYSFNWGIIKGVNVKDQTNNNIFRYNSVILFVKSIQRLQNIILHNAWNHLEYTSIQLRDQNEKWVWNNIPALHTAKYNYWLQFLTLNFQIRAWIHCAMRNNASKVSAESGLLRKIATINMSVLGG